MMGSIFLLRKNDEEEMVCLRETMKKTCFAIVAVFCFSILLPPHLAFAQEDELKLHLSRNFGYSSGTGKIQGTFTVSADGPADLNRVSFYLDGQLIGEVRQLPYKLRFNTDGYALGVHTMYALGETSDGRSLRSNEIRMEFVSAEAGWQAGMRFALPIFAVAFGAMALSLVFMLLSAGKQRALPLGSSRKYGVAGGAICPKCGRAFRRHLFSPNLGAGKLERCPFCGKWNVVKASTMAELRAAELAELEKDRQPGHIASQEDFQKELEDSRFMDL
jgi:hypothetical protein